MKIALGSDHAGFAYKEKAKALLISLGHEVVDCGTDSDAPSVTVKYSENSLATNGGVNELYRRITVDRPSRRPRCAQSGDRKPSKQRFVVRSGDRNWQAGSVSLAA